MRTGHTAAPQGKTVVVHMRNGGKFVARFKQRRSRYIEFLDHRRVASALVRTISLFKEDAG